MKNKKVLTTKRGRSNIGIQPPALSSRVPSRGFLVLKGSFVLIDGENFVHGLERNLKKQGLVKSRNGFHKIVLSHILNFAPNVIVNYYTNTVRVPKTSALFSQAKKMSKWNSTWIPYLRYNGINIVKAGLLRVRDGKVCPKCKTKSEILLEKGVDVRVAIDIVSLSGKRNKVYVLSSDTDLIPAFERAVSMGHEVVYVAFPGEIVNSIANAASSVVELTDAQIKKAFLEVNKK